MSNLRGAFINGEATPLTVGDLVRPGATGLQILAARSNTLTGSLATGVLVTGPASGEQGIVQSGGVALVNIVGSAPAVGDMLYVSNTDAGKAQVTIPLSGLITEVGRAQGNNGTQTLVALDFRAATTTTRRAKLYDDFVGGTHSSGTVGDLGWGFTNGSWVTVAPNNSTQYGLRRRTSSAVSGQVSDWRLTNFSGAQNIRQDGWASHLQRVNPSQSGANSHTHRVGVMNDTTANPPTNGCYFERLTTEANWFQVTRAGGVETRNDTGVAYTATTDYALMMRKAANGTDIQFFINGVASAVPSHSTNLPAGSTAMVQGGHLIPNTAAARDVDIDLFEEESVLLAR